jgi:hypothetical protein
MLRRSNAGLKSGGYGPFVLYGDKWTTFTVLTRFASGWSDGNA